MKKLLFFSTFVFVLFAPKVCDAQSQYYYRTGDTIVDRSPIYFYQWWSDNWLADTSHRLYLSHIDWTEWRNWYPTELSGQYGASLYFLPHGEFLQYCFTDSPLQIIGIATAAVPTVDNHPIEFPYEPEYNEHLRLYEADRTSFTLLKEVEWNYYTPKRYMKIDVRGKDYYQNGECCYEGYTDTAYYVGIREYYFEKPVTVSDSFYIGITTEAYYNNFPPYMENPQRNTFFVNGICIYYDSTELSNNPAHAHCDNFCVSTPKTFHKFRHIAWNQTTGDTIDRNWHWWYSPHLMLHFPIVVIDSSYIIPPYECPPVQNIRIAQQGEGMAYLMWDTHQDHNAWQISYGPQGVEPDSGTLVNCPIQVGQMENLDSCTHYTAYVRAVCNHDSICYSQWSDPVEVYVCDTAGGGEQPEGFASAANIMTHVIPNPASSKVNVYSSFYINRVEVYNLNGRRMADIEVKEHSTSFDVSQWPSGIYIVTIHTQVGNVTKKLVVQ